MSSSGSGASSCFASEFVFFKEVRPALRIEDSRSFRPSGAEGGGLARAAVGGGTYKFQRRNVLLIVMAGEERPIMSEKHITCRPGIGGGGGPPFELEKFKLCLPFLALAVVVDLPLN